MSFFDFFITSITDYLSNFQFLQTPKEVSQKIHDYTQLNPGEDYLFETIEDGKKAYLTGQDHRLKRGDYIILPNNSGSSRYQVDSIEYYSEAPDIWIALLNKVSND